MIDKQFKKEAFKESVKENVKFLIAKNWKKLLRSRSFRLYATP